MKKLSSFFRAILQYKNYTFMTKLFLFSSFIVILPIITVGFISYYISSIELKEEATHYNLQVIEQVEARIEYYIRDFDLTSLKIVNSPEISKFSTLHPQEEDDNGHIREAVQKVLKDAQYSRPDISNITVYLDNQARFIDLLGNRNYYPAYKIRNEYWYSSVPHNGLAILVSRTLTLKDKEEPVISLIRRLYNPETLQPVGMLIIDINFRRIREFSDKVTPGNNGYFFILDSNGHYVYHPNQSILGEKGKLSGLLHLPSESSGSILLKNDRRDFVTYTFSNDLGWTFFTANPYEDITKGTILIRRTIIWTIVISLIVAYLLGFVFAKGLLRPIKRLHLFMKEVEVGKLDSRVKIETNDEIGQLSKGFNSMVQKLSDLLEEVYFAKLRETEISLRQKEIELQVLQSQINPHFLYNSLETIRGMALEENQEHIATMSSSLGKLLRYNLRNTSPTVSLQEELKFSEMYLQIQKFRFGNRFEYESDIPRWAKNLTVLKFTLQPILENCFLHGIRSASAMILISIIVYKDSASSFIIEVRDTGAGISEEELRNILFNLEHREITNGGTSIGIINVHQRIVKSFGSEYGIRLDTFNGKGTSVKIRMPIVELEEEANVQHLTGR
ncbi:sensor histidine kinase [Bacillus sp. SA1-12]|uniref:sensor histidine kinase n=1 Tax=Bacillus sp. SA1-12 TaxID=1455638 RepID=UPI000696AAEB|nr:histidine kinase [Bacillus sp. SA1-12]